MKKLATYLAVGAVTLASVVAIGTISGASGATTTVHQSTTTVGDGTASVTATVRVADTVANGSAVLNAREHNVVIDVTYEHNGSAISFPQNSVGTYGVIDLIAEGAERTVGAKQLRPVNDHRFRARYELSDTTGSYQVVNLEQSVAVTMADGSVHELRFARNELDLAFDVSRLAEIRATFAPRSVPVGRSIHVDGIMEVLTAGYEPASGRQVKIWFDPDGSATRRHLATVTTDARGHFTTTLKATSSGTYSAEYAGSSTEVPARMSQRVTVRSSTAYRETTINLSPSTGAVRTRVTVPTSITVGTRPVSAPVDVTFLRAGGWDTHTSNWSLGLSTAPLKVGTSNEPFHAWDDHSAQGALWFDPTTPPGAYTVKVRNIDVGTIQVKKSTSMTLAATPPNPLKTTKHSIRGAVKTPTFNTTTGNGYAWTGVAGLAVKLYFDPAGSAGPSYKTAVRTGSNGTFAYAAAVTTRGTWIAKYAGSSNFVASSSSKAVKKATSLSVKAATTRPLSGRSNTLRGTLKTVKKTSTGTAWRGVGGAKVQIWFDPYGTATPRLKKTLTTGGSGAFKYTIASSKRGVWIVKYRGSATYNPRSAKVKIAPR